MTDRLRVILCHKSIPEDVTCADEQRLAEATSALDGGQFHFVPSELFPPSLGLPRGLFHLFT